MSWDITNPLNSESEKLGDDRIRDAKSALQTALQNEKTFPGPDPATNPVCIDKLPVGATTDRPAATAPYEGRWFYNRTTGTIQRNSSAPAWADITAPAQLFPSGSVLVFYQAAAPTGWSQLVTADLNDRALRVVSGTGSGSGGSDSIASPPTHNHSGNSGNADLTHTHTITNTKTKISTGSPSVNGILDPLSTTGNSFRVPGFAPDTHAHAISSVQGFAPGYIDMILGVKN